MDVVGAVTNLQSLLQGDLVANMTRIEDAAQDAVKALSKGGNADELQKSLLTLKKGPIIRFDWMVNSDPATYLRSVLKGDIRVVLIAAFAGRPIAYPLLAIKHALETRYDPEDDSGITVAGLLGVIRGFDIQKFKGPVNIIQSLSMDASMTKPEDAALLNIMMPQVRVSATDFTPSPVTWNESYVPISIPTPRIENRQIVPIQTLTHSGGGTTKWEPGDSEDSNSFMPLLITLLLVCVAALALIKGYGR